MHKVLLPASLLVVLAVVAGCPSPPEKAPVYPPREPNCEVRIFPDSPTYPVGNIGPVSATCDESVSDTDCMRTLMDQGCKIGADTIWGVSDKPELKHNKKYFNGRGAHQK